MENTDNNGEYCYGYLNQPTHQETEGQLYFTTDFEQYPITYGTPINSFYLQSLALNSSRQTTDVNQYILQHQYNQNDNITGFLAENNMLFPRCSSSHLPTADTFDYTNPEVFVNNQGLVQAKPSSGFYRQEKDVYSELMSLAKKDTRHSLSENELKENDSNTEKCALDRFYRTPYDDSHSIKNKLIYQLKVVQHPSRARMCGFGDKDRRSIVPTPIIQLLVKDEDGSELDSKTFDATFLVTMCDFCSLENEREPSTNKSRKHNTSPSHIGVFSSSKIGKGSTGYTKNLIGTTVASANKLYNLDGKLGIFFVFHDLSLRTEGNFRLKFSLIDVSSSLYQNVKTEPLSTVIETVYSDPFTVYPAKKYPGVLRKLRHYFQILNF